MRKIAIVFLPVLMVTIGRTTQATMVEVDFRHNAVVQEGDSYYRVTVWDDAIVVITGGEVEQIAQYNSSTVTVIDVSGVWWFELGDSSTANLYGGSFETLYAPGSHSCFNIYGYGFVVDRSADLWRLTGFWPDGSPLEMYLRRADQYGDHYVIHEVPEPATAILLVLGSLFLTKKRQLRSVKGRI
jgi:hypothetical protein